MENINHKAMFQIVSFVNNDEIYVQEVMWEI